MVTGASLADGDSNEKTTQFVTAIKYYEIPSYLFGYKATFINGLPGLLALEQQFLSGSAFFIRVQNESFHRDTGMKGEEGGVETV